ncbi:MacS family sensor histidine kinase [Spirillospora sp. CA-294931]|uniref:MacS family sensor histidine kinase n=1 Tax=Spirillospora sp. CA-294931 TaxID=3240042 RepID=UPI003D8EB58A
MGLEVALWRAVAFFRWAALLFAAFLIIKNFDRYEYPAAGWVVLGVMTAWTAYATFAFADERRRGRTLLLADLAVATGCLVSTAWIEDAGRLARGEPTLTVSWVAAVILSWAVSGGKRLGIVAAAVLALANVLIHMIAGTEERLPYTLNSLVLLFLAGLVVGHVVKLARDAEARLARAVELESATRERERLARRIHDSVLQVLAMVQRRGGELGGEAAELGRLAGEQEAALRALISSGTSVPAAPVRAEGERLDLRTLLGALASTTVTVSSPATPVELPGHTAREVEAAVAAALDNVRRHCGDGTRAWVLLEDDGAGEVIVSVRDDGPGMPPRRLAEAAADGRLGVAQSIKGRIRDLGGTVEIVSAPGQGTEIEMIVPAGS